MKKQEQNEAFLDQRNQLSDVVADILVSDLTDIDVIKEKLAEAVYKMKNSGDVTYWHMKYSADRYYNGGHPSDILVINKVK